MTLRVVGDGMMGQRIEAVTRVKVQEQVLPRGDALRVLGDNVPVPAGESNR